jgi:hypothetical protein
MLFATQILSEGAKGKSRLHVLTFAFDFVCRPNQRLGFDEDVSDLRVPIADLRLQTIDR